MLTTIEGVYKYGKIERSETPEGAEERPVLATSLERNGGTAPLKPRLAG